MESLLVKPKRSSKLMMAPTSSILASVSVGVGVGVGSPKKSCLKKTTSFPDLLDQEEGESSSQFLQSKPRRRSNQDLLQQAKNSRRARRRRQPAPEATLHKSSTDTNLRLMLTTQKPVRSILKKESKDKDQDKSKSPIRKGVSWSNDMNRWHSQGSGLNLQSLVDLTQKNRSATRDAPKGNHQWGADTTAAATTTTSTPKSAMSTLSLSRLKDEMRKHQAPCKPVRRGSWSDDDDVQHSNAKALPKHKSLGAMATTKKTNANYNPFQSAVADFQKTMVLELQQQNLNRYRAPAQPVRQTHILPLVNKTGTRTGSTNNNPFQAAVADFQKHIVHEAQKDFRNNIMPTSCVSVEH